MNWKPSRTAVVVALFCVGLTVLSFFRASSGQCALLPYAPAAADAPLPSLSDWEWTGLDGTVHRAADYADRVLIYTFWTTWCVNCRHEMPTFADLQDQIAGVGGQVLGINLDEAPGASVEEFARSTGINFPVLLPPAPLREQFVAALRSVPTTLVVAPGGTVLARFEGVVERATLEATIAPYLRGGDRAVAAHR